jgi:hypothetical protein
VHRGDSCLGLQRSGRSGGESAVEERCRAIHRLVVPPGSILIRQRYRIAVRVDPRIAPRVVK